MYTSQNCYSSILQQQNLQQNTIYKDLCKQIPNIAGHKSDEQDEDGFTVAMVLVINNIKIPKQWEHKPDIQNKYGYTVAMYMALRGTIPPKQWIHDPRIETKDKYTVAKFLLLKGITPPKEWEYQENYLKYYNIALQSSENDSTSSIQSYYNQFKIFNYCGTMEMILAVYGIQNIQQWYHDPSIQNQYNDTVAMILAKNKYIPQQQWHHKPTITNNDQQTVAMLISKYCKIVPQEQWNHYPLMKDKNLSTVAIYLAQNGVFPPKQWINDINYENKDGDSIKSLINNHIYNLFQQDFQSRKYLTRNTNDICSICLQDGEQQFIISSCGHKVCFECFKELKKTGQREYCQYVDNRIGMIIHYINNQIKNGLNLLKV